MEDICSLMLNLQKDSLFLVKCPTISYLCNQYSYHHIYQSFNDNMLYHFLVTQPNTMVIKVIFAQHLYNFGYILALYICNFSSHFECTFSIYNQIRLLQYILLMIQDFELFFHHVVKSVSQYIVYFIYNLHIHWLVIH